MADRESGNFSGFRRQVRRGASSRDEAMAIIKSSQDAARPRRHPGSLRGKIHRAPDFDTLPAEVLASMVGQ